VVRQPRVEATAAAVPRLSPGLGIRESAWSFYAIRGMVDESDVVLVRAKSLGPEKLLAMFTGDHLSRSTCCCSRWITLPTSW